MLEIEPFVNKTNRYSIQETGLRNYLSFAVSLSKKYFKYQIQKSHMTPECHEA